jgi:hypothetical protein
MKHIASYARFLAKELMGVKVVVTVVRTTNNFIACYGSGRLDFNLFCHGHSALAPHPPPFVRLPNSPCTHVDGCQNAAARDESVDAEQMAEV